MSVPLRSSDFESYSAYDEDDFYPSEFEASPGERIGGPVSHAHDVLAWCVSLAIVLGGAWIMIHDEGVLLRRLPELAARVSNSVAKFAHVPGDAVPNAPAASAPLPVPPPSAAAEPAPLPEATAVAEPPAIKSEPMAQPSSDAAQKPDAASHDVHRARAEAAGLNPDISRALLMRFSENDFRNARIAIDRAVAKTPDGGVFVWPRQRKPKDALFQVKFVEGAGPDCRRYVVTVTMDNWSTTALPMEKCGVPKIARRVAAKDSAQKRAEP